MSFLEIALDCIRRGWYVFPCKPRSKEPQIHGGWKAASSSEEQVRAWWAKWPDANVAIATPQSKLVVHDCDHGLTDAAQAEAVQAAQGLTPTYTVRTGRRDTFGVQRYYSGDDVRTIQHWVVGACSGDIRGGTHGYVMAAGCIHPDSGERYEVLHDLPIAPVPSAVRKLYPVPVERTDGRGLPERVIDSEGPITEWRNDAMIRLLGKARARGADDDKIRETAIDINNTRMADNPLGEEELERLITNACKWPIGQPDPIAVLRDEKKVTDWRERYLTFERVRDAKPVEFFIHGFLAVDSITALAAPVGQRKSLIALNVTHALCTGERLFDYFNVSRKPERVVYLCPEMGLSSFSTRLKGIGLLDYVGKTLFCQTMDEESIHLSDLNEELPGSVVIIDTLTRFVEGDQNSSEDMSKFAAQIFRLKRAGATVLLLHHSIKGANGTLSLDSAMRGSSELAAFITSCWATRLTDPEHPYASPSLLANCKQRDFESKPFSATSDKNCRMHIVGEPGTVAELKSQADADAEKILAALLKDSPNMGINKIQEALKAAGKGHGAKWVKRKRVELAGTGVALKSD